MSAPVSVTTVATITSASGASRAVVRFDDGRLCLVERVSDDGIATPLFNPAPLGQLVGFAEQVLAGKPSALTHPKALLVLATCALALLVPDLSQQTPEASQQKDG